MLDLPRLHGQLLGLERRTSRAGKDSFDHAPGQHDDAVNAACSALVAAGGAIECGEVAASGLADEPYESVMSLERLRRELL